MFIKTDRGTVNIRPAQEADAVSFRALRLEALYHHPQAFGADYAVNAAQPPEFWVERLRGLGSAGMIYFADHEDGLVGMCGIRREGSPKTQHSATIWGVYLQPEWRGFHITDALIAACCVWARSHQVKIAKLGVVVTNTAAIRCYARCGFTVYGIEPQAICCDGEMHDELLMAKSIGEGTI